MSIARGPADSTSKSLAAVSTWSGVHPHRRLNEAKGDRAKAASHYACFLEYWKNVDPDLQPKVAEARARLQALSRVEAGPPE